MSKSHASHRSLAIVTLILSLAACGGDGGNDPNPDAAPTAAERAAMATSLADAATVAAASGDALSAALLGGAAGAVQNGLSVTAGIRASDLSASALAGPPSSPRIFTVAVGVELLNDQSGITGYSGAIVINGSSVAFGLGESNFGTFPTTAIGGIITGPNAGWVATAGTVGGLIQSLGPTGCGFNLSAPVVQCQPGTYKLVSLDITQSAPMTFQGNTATGSSTFSMPSRTPVKGVEVTVDCNLTTFC